MIAVSTWCFAKCTTLIPQHPSAMSDIQLRSDRLSLFICVSEPAPWCHISHPLAAQQPLKLNLAWFVLFACQAFALITVPQDSSHVLMVFLYSVCRAVARHISLSVCCKNNGRLLNSLQMHGQVPNLRILWQIRILLILFTFMLCWIGVDR